MQSIERASQIFWAETRALRDAREHARADFFAFVKGENVIVPALASENAVRTRLPLEIPADAMKRPQHAACLRRAPGSHAANSLRASSGSGSPLSISIGDNAQR